MTTYPSQPGSGGAPQRPHALPESESSDRSGDAEAEAALLESVLEQTLGAEDPNELLERVPLDILADVVRAYRGQPLLLDPVAVELVQVVLEQRFDTAATQGEVWKNVSRRIAQTLMDDPAGRARLETLWDRACEALS